LAGGGRDYEGAPSYVTCHMLLITPETGQAFARACRLSASKDEGYKWLVHIFIIYWLLSGMLLFRNSNMKIFVHAELWRMHWESL